MKCMFCPVSNNLSHLTWTFFLLLLNEKVYIFRARISQSILGKSSYVKIIIFWIRKVFISSVILILFKKGICDECPKSKYICMIRREMNTNLIKRIWLKMGWHKWSHQIGELDENGSSLVIWLADATKWDKNRQMCCFRFVFTGSEWLYIELRSFGGRLGEVQCYFFSLPMR